MARNAWTGRNARELLAARDPRDLLAAWLAVVDPPASFAALVVPPPGDCVLFRRDGGRFRPLAAPPIRGTVPGPAEGLALLPGGRVDALDDLLWSLGAGRRLSLPVGTPPRARLVLGDTGLAGEPPEVRREDLEWLLAGMEALERPGREGGDREVPVLVGLVRALGRAVDGAGAARAAALALDDLLLPAAGAIVLRARDGELLAALAWPPGPAGEEALGRAGASREEAGDRFAWRGPPRRGEVPREWIDPRGGRGARITLGFSGPPPAAARRLAATVEGSLALAADRLDLQRRREASRLAAAFEGLPVGVVLVSREGRVRLVNREGRVMLERLGAWPGEGEALPSLGSLRLAELRERASSGGSAPVDLVQPRDGRILSVRLVPLRDRAGDALLVLEDVTVARRQQAQLARAEKMTALGVLVGGIVHEINNPLSTIRGYAQMLAAAPDAEHRAEWIATLVEETDRCRRIVGDLLTFARTKEPTRQPVAPGAIAEKVVGLLGYHARRAGVELVVEGAGECPPVEADADGLVQVLVNLVTNAIHALEEHDGERRVTIRLRAAGEDHVRIEVADTGPGIPPDVRDRVFDPFFTTKPEGKGTGLGLSVVAGIVRDHGGEVRVESSRGGGALFVLRLPRRGRRPGKEGPSSTPGPAAPLAGRRVLVAEDEPAVAGLLREVLENDGAEVAVVGDGETAARRIVAERPDAIVCDVSLPRRTGLELVATLRREAPHLVGRVVLTTGDLSLAERLAREPGAPPVLAKPFDLGRLLAAVRRAARTPPPAAGRAPAGEARP